MWLDVDVNFSPIFWLSRRELCSVKTTSIFMSTHNCSSASTMFVIELTKRWWVCQTKPQVKQNPPMAGWVNWLVWLNKWWEAESNWRQAGGCTMSWIVPRGNGCTFLLRLPGHYWPVTQCCRYCEDRSEQLLRGLPYTSLRGGKQTPVPAKHHGHLHWIRTRLLIVMSDCTNTIRRI